MNKETLDNGATDQDSVEGLIEKAYNCLKEQDAACALRFLQEALKIDYEHPEVKFGLKCANWWLERIKKLEDFHEPFEKGMYFMSQWKSFQVFLDQMRQIGQTQDAEGSKAAAGNLLPFDSCLYAFRCFAFGLALNHFLDVLAGAGNRPDADVLLQTGRCYKGIGNYEEAAKFLEQAVRLRPEDSAALAELADVDAVLGDPRAAKVLFREAFFLDPQAIDLWSMESEMIIRLREKVAELGYGGRELAEWIPVYGTLWGVFSVRRELKPVELGKLKQSILAMESESSGSRDGFLKPRLINRYFRLIDHCGSVRSGNVRDNSDVVEDTMRKIKFVDAAIYEQYHN